MTPAERELLIQIGRVSVMIGESLVMTGNWLGYPHSFATASQDTAYLSDLKDAIRRVENERQDKSQD